MKKSFNKTFTIIFLLVTIFALMTQVNASLYLIKGDDYRIQFNPDDVLMNTTLMMTRGDIIEKNITITDENKTLTILTEILNHTGRLWGLYIENSSFYYNAKKTENYAGFEKLMDHVSNYTVKHVTRTPGDYVLAFHDAHMHPEPDTYFNIIILKGYLGQETIFMSDMTDEPTTSFSTLFIFLTLFTLGIIIRYRKRTI